METLKKAFLCITWLLIIQSCDAPRENPFDPDADNYRAPYVSTVFIQEKMLPHQGIPGVTLIEKQLQLFGETDASGMVKWQHERIDSITITANRADFFTKTTSFELTGAENTFDVYLNAKPIIESLDFFSKLTNAPDPFGQVITLTINATVTDPDGTGDIVIIYIQDESDTFKDTLSVENSFQNSYECTFDLSAISNDLTASSILEHNFRLYVRNPGNDSIVSAPFSIKRVIDYVPILNKPGDGAVETDSILFEWEKIDLDFDFKLNVVLTPQYSGEEVRRFNITPADTTAFVLQETIPDGRYFWQLEIIDNLGNICISDFENFRYE